MFLKDVTRAVVVNSTAVFHFKEMVLNESIYLHH